MPMTQPFDRIEYTKREVSRYKADVESWQSDHDALAVNCRAWEDAIARANFVLGRIMHADVQIQRYILLDRGEIESGVEEKPRELLGAWLNISLLVVPHGDRLQGDYGHVEGLDLLKGNVREAKSILTPDDEYFDPDKLAPLRDGAIAAHRLGRTEPLLENERAH